MGQEAKKKKNIKDFEWLEEIPVNTDLQGILTSKEKEAGAIAVDLDLRFLLDQSTEKRMKVKK